MKTLPMMVAGITLLWASAPAWGGYSDLKRDLDGYVPPTLLPSSTVATPPENKGSGSITADTATIQRMRERWEKVVAETTAAFGETGIQPAIHDAAVDDAQTLDLLTPRFSLLTLQSLILVRNPSVRAARDRLQAALEGFDQVTQLDDILRQYSAFTEAVMPGVGPMQGMDDIRMQFPFPGVTALKGQVAEKNVEAEKQAFNIVRRDSVAQGRKAYWNLLYTRRAQQITRNTLNRLNQLESVATTRYGAGKTNYQDVIKIRISREKLEEQLATLRGQRVNLETELLALMHLPPGPSLGVPETITPDSSVPPPERLYPLALERRQELKRMRAMIGKMERMLEMAETMIQPALSQNLSLYLDEAALQVGSAATKPTFGTAVSPSRGKGLPKTPWFGTRDAYLRETRRRLDALRADLADAEARTRVMVRKGWFDLDRARRERSLYKNRLLGLSRTSLDVSTKGYESGRVSFADVIGSYTGWLDVNLSSQRRNSDVGIARAELERRVGAPLP